MAKNETDIEMAKIQISSTFRAEKPNSENENDVQTV
jgi:hypothetical protein